MPGPAIVGIVIGVAIGAMLVVEVRRRIAAAAARVPLAAAPISSFEDAPVLDRAA